MPYLAYILSNHLGPMCFNFMSHKLHKSCNFQTVKYLMFLLSSFSLVGKSHCKLIVSVDVNSEVLAFFFFFLSVVVYSLSYHIIERHARDRISLSSVYAIYRCKLNCDGRNPRDAITKQAALQRAGFGLIYPFYSV